MKDPAETPSSAQPEEQKETDLSPLELNHLLSSLPSKPPIPAVVGRTLSRMLLKRKLKMFLAKFPNAVRNKALMDPRYHSLFHTLSTYPDNQEAILDLFLLRHLEWLTDWSPLFRKKKEALFARVHQNLEVYRQLPYRLVGEEEREALDRWENRERPLVEREEEEKEKNGALLCNWIYATLHYPAVAATLFTLSLHGTAALKLAIQYEDTTVVRHLLQHAEQFCIQTYTLRLNTLGLTLHLYADRGYTPRMQVACLPANHPNRIAFQESYQDRVQILGLLLDKLREIDLESVQKRIFYASDKISLRSVQEVISYGNLEILEILLPHIPPERMREEGVHLLCSALIDFGLPPEHTDYGSMQEPHGAILYQMLSLLLQQGADPQRGDEWENTPLFYALIRMKKRRDISDLAIVRLLLQYGADGNTALELAITYNSVDVVHALLQDAAALHLQVEQKYKNFLTPLQLAVKQHTQRKDADTAVILALLDSGANPNPALHTAIEGSNPQIVKMLLQRDVDIEWKDNTAATPLFNALEKAAFLHLTRKLQSLAPAEEIIELLLEKGADPNASGIEVLYKDLFQKMHTNITALTLNYHFIHTYRVVQEIYRDNPELAPHYLLPAYITHLKKLEDRWFNKIAGLDKTVIAWAEKKAAECENDALKMAALVTAVQKMCPEVQFTPTAKTAALVAPPTTAPLFSFLSRTPSPAAPPVAAAAVEVEKKQTIVQHSAAFFDALPVARVFVAKDPRKQENGAHANDLTGTTNDDLDFGL